MGLTWLPLGVCSAGPNPSPKRNGLWAILDIKECARIHTSKNRPELVDHPGTFGILFSTYYALGHIYFYLTHYLVWTLGHREKDDDQLHGTNKARLECFGFVNSKRIL